MTPQTEVVLKQIIKADESIDKRDAVRAFALLRNQPQCLYPPTPILRISQVMQMLGVSRSTLYRFFDQGILKRLYGEGKNALGVTQDSYIAFTSQPPKRTESQ